MSRTLLAVLIVAALALPLAAAQEADPVDLRLRLTPGHVPEAEGDVEILSSTASATNLTWRLRLTEPWTVVEVRDEGYFAVERARQIVPTLRVPHEEYPLFTPILRHVWDIDAVPRYGLYNESMDGSTRVIELGLPGPRDGGPGEPFEAVLTLERDATPPKLTRGPVQNLTWRDFYQEAATDELSLVDLVVCCDPHGDEIHNPTQVYHYLHRFPIQGLDPTKTYTLRMVATDWAGNGNVSESYQITTPAKPYVPTPVVTAIAPAPNSTADRDVTITARIESPDVPLAANGIRLFVDKKPVTSNLRFDNGTFTYAARLDKGTHSVGIEAENEQGGIGHASWTFRVGSDAPGAPAMALVAAAAAAALLLRRRA